MFPRFKLDCWQDYFYYVTKQVWKSKSSHLYRFSAKRVFSSSSWTQQNVVNNDFRHRVTNLLCEQCTETMVRQRENKTPAPCSKQFVVHFFVAIAKNVASNKTTKHFGVTSPINATAKTTNHFRCLAHFSLFFWQQVNTFFTTEALLLSTSRWSISLHWLGHGAAIRYTVCWQTIFSHRLV